MKARNIAFSLSCGLAVLPGVAQAHAPATVRDQQDSFKECVTQLKQLETQDDLTKRYSPSIQAMLRHVFIQDLTPTKSEKQVANVFIDDDLDNASRVDSSEAPSNVARHKNSFLMKTRGSGLTFKLAILKSTLMQMPGLDPRPRFVAEVRRTPFSTQKIGCVEVHIGTRSSTLVDVPASSGSFSAGQRANAVKARLQTLAANDPLFWTRLSVRRTPDGQYVVANASTPDGFIITADDKFAKMRNCSPKQLAEDLVASIRSTFDPAPTRFSRAVADPGDLSAAQQLFEDGSAALDKGDFATGETALKQAIEKNPSLTAAYSELGALYVSQHRSADAKALEGKLISQTKQTFDNPHEPQGGVRDVDMSAAHRSTVQMFEHGNALYTKGDINGAEAAYQSVIASEMDYAAAYEALGGLYLKAGKTDQAKEMLTKALTLTGLDPSDRTQINRMLKSIK